MISMERLEEARKRIYSSRGPQLSESELTQEEMIWLAIQGDGILNDMVLSGRPYAAAYRFLNPGLSLMSEMYNDSGYRKHGYKDTEAVYKACIRREVTWEELLNYKGPDPNKIL